MKILATTCKIIGYVLLYAGCLLIFLGIILTWLKDGFTEVQKLMNPFNVINYMVMFATLMPGYLFIWLSEKLKPKELTEDCR